MLAAWDGRLERMPEIDAAEAAKIQAALEEYLGYRPKPPPAGHPPVAEVLSVDREYREKASAGQLHRVAPWRHNPEHVAWLPVLHTLRGLRRYSAQFSNTSLAHSLGKTRDWVIVYYFALGRARQDTVATQTEGDLAGLRVVCGREPETREHYRSEGALARPLGSMAAEEARG